MSTAYHARYFAHDLTRRAATTGVERLARSLFDACVDLNPHQIEAALFAFRSPLSKGVLLADEVGLGKTIEAGLVLCQYWAEKKRKLLVVCPASLRKQWSLELKDKFNLPTVILDAKSYNDARRRGLLTPFDQEAVIITSMNFAGKMKDEVRLVSWDLAVIDEAHKLRNCYRTSNRIGQAIRWALEDRRKVLLTATPLQNSLLELYGLSTLIDDHIFGDLAAFRDNYVNDGGNVDALKSRINSFCQRTLRRQVLEYIKFTERRAITRPFNPTDEEQGLYEALSGFLQRADTFSIPKEQQQLVTLVIRKVLASSSRAVVGTLETIRDRLVRVKEGLPLEESLVDELSETDEITTEDYVEGEDDPDAENGTPALIEPGPPQIDRQKLDDEIAELNRYVDWARSIQTDTKIRALLSGLEIGFKELKRMGAARKAIIFTESLRTQRYLLDYLEANGYAGRIVLFSGSNTGEQPRAIYERWLAINKPLGRTSESRIADQRQSLIEHFRDNADIMIATESAAEGINLQFCSLVINYDLPWNPQRIEQRIGRCHRYGQRHDVVVINFLNERNAADQRVFQLLNEKFSLFSGVFGASDEVLGSIESGVDFEKRVLGIYQSCRTVEQIEFAFNQLQNDMVERIKAAMLKTRQQLLEHFDEDVHQRLRFQLDETRTTLDRVSKEFWTLTRFILADHAAFNDQALRFTLKVAPRPDIRCGEYHLISKAGENVDGDFLYRLSHPLGENVIAQGQSLPTPTARLTFNISDHPVRITLVENLKGKQGALILTVLTIESYSREEYLLFSGFVDGGGTLDQETAEKLFNCGATVNPATLSTPDQDRLKRESDRHVAATISRSLDANNRYFQEERDKLEKWADDLVQAAEQELQDTKNRIKLLTRQSRQATTTEEMHRLESEIADLEKAKRRQRQQIFDREDEIMARRDTLIGNLEKRLAQTTKSETLFSIRWEVV
jgi:SNF2-related domain/Helicase conserved C-terminal domain